MSHREKLPLIFLMLNIAIVLGITSFLLLKFSSKEIVENNVLGAETQTTEAELPDLYSSLDICTKDTCWTITGKAVESFYTNGLLQEADLNAYLQSKVIPYFESFYGGKQTVHNNNGEFNTWIKDVHPDFTNMLADIEGILNRNKNGKAIDTYNLTVDSLPGTDGTYAAKYMEVDNSAQKMYVWMDEKVVRTIGLSGPVYGFQVYGVFPIVDKGIEPIAPGGKRMPYWMAFYYSKSQSSWYGLHALIWWYDANGNKIYENTKNIGTRQSAGCIRMLLADAKYLYENFKVGDILLIHE